MCKCIVYVYIVLFISLIHYRFYIHIKRSIKLSTSSRLWNEVYRNIEHCLLWILSKRSFVLVYFKMVWWIRLSDLNSFPFSKCNPFFISLFFCHWMIFILLAIDLFLNKLKYNWNQKVNRMWRINKISLAYFDAFFSSLWIFVLHTWLFLCLCFSLWCRCLQSVKTQLNCPSIHRNRFLNSIFA